MRFNKLFQHIRAELAEPPLRCLIVVPFLLQISATVGVTGWLSWRHGQAAVQLAVEQVVYEASEHIVYHIEDYTDKPYQLNALNVHAVEHGLLDLGNIDLMTTYFMEQLALYEAITFIGFGSEAGEFVGVNRLPGGRFQQQIATQATGMALEDHLLDASGQPTVTLNREPGYNVHRQAWYQTAQAATGPVWGDIRPYFSAQGLALSINAPLFIDDELQGVIGVGYDLSFTSQFLGELDIGQTGEAFILERDGSIVASSMNHTPYQVASGGSKRLSVFESETKLVRLAMARLLEQVGSLEAINEPLQTVVICEGQRKFVRVVPLKNIHGLDWLTVVTVPESDFDQQIRANSQATILLCLLALAIATGVGIVTARHITQPLLALHQATTRISQGQLDYPQVGNSSREINELAGAFSKMSGQLKNAFQDLQQANAALLKSEHRLHAFLEALPVGVVVLDPQSQPTYLNRAAKQLFGLAPDETWPKSLKAICQFYYSETQEPCAEADLPCQRALQGEVVHSTDLEIHQGQQRIPVEAWSTPIFEEPGKGAPGEVLYAVTALQDISERKRTEQQLVYSARYDGLTHLPNRHFFMEQLVEMVRQPSPPLFAVLFIDLDQFKLINDSLGHLAGDHVLVMAATKLQAAIRSHDIIARFGGDEFVVLLRAIASINDAIQVAERILTEFEQPILVEGHQAVITASVGIAIGQNCPNANALLRDADVALYQAKADGRASYKLFDPAMHQQAIAQMTLERDLRRGIERQEFLLHYQPIICLKTQRLVGFEALARWHAPSGDILSPQSFIDIAEDSGLIVDIDLGLIRKAILQLAAWRRQYRQAADLTVAVNLSVYDIRSPRLVETIVQALQDANLSGAAMTLEITESVLLNLNDFEQLLPLKDYGVRISIDDFGTGYSSLSYLCWLPVDMLKIDQSFIRHMQTQPKKQMVVETMLSLSRQLNLLVTAEGIETAEQVKLLRQLGCHFGQGYLFAEALPPETIEHRLAQPVGSGIFR